MRHPVLRSVAALTAGLALTQCTTEVCDCPALPVTALVHGRVTSPAAEPVAGSQVNAYSAPASGCHADAGSGFDYGSIATGADGTYSLQLVALTGGDSICVFVFAQPAPGATGLAVSDTTLVVLNFDFAGPQDSAQVNPVLRAQ
jgi:hypothetical protein